MTWFWLLKTAYDAEIVTVTNFRAAQIPSHKIGVSDCHNQGRLRTHVCRSTENGIQCLFTYVDIVCGVRLLNGSNDLKSVNSRSVKMLILCHY